MRKFRTKFLLAAMTLSGSWALDSHGQQRGRPSFDMILQRHDANDDGKISEKEFRGPERFFRRLDADGDGIVDKKEFESGRRGMRRKADERQTRGRGKDSARSSRMKRYEVFPTQNPAPGDKAPEIELRDLNGKLVTLSDLLKTKPVLIETGSYTCPVFRNRHASIEELHDEFSDQVHLVVLYGKEAHPGSGHSENIQQPKQNDERIKLAQLAANKLSIGVPVLTDDVNNLITTAYGGLPNCGYLIGQDGRVFHKLGWIHPTLMREPLAALLKLGGSGGPNPPIFPVGGNRPNESGVAQEVTLPSSNLPEKKADLSDNSERRSKRQRKGQRKMRIPDGVTAHRDIEYARVDDHSLQLDLYLPDSPSSNSKKTKPPLLMWVHGGGWRNGDKGRINSMFIQLVGEGYAAASINYRLNGLAGHPEHIHDCKAAVRWLRANAEEYGYDTTRIGVGGGSAGGHLVLMLGMTANVEELEGNIGEHLDQSSRVAAVLDLFGPSDFVTFSKGNSRFRSRHQVPADRLLSASPLHYLTDDDAPVLIFQGDEDSTVPLSQSELQHDRYQKAGLESTLHIIAGAGHGGPQFSDETRYALAKAFFEKHLSE